jgi:dihydrolipoamide dehydrogenase
MQKFDLIIIGSGGGTKLRPASDFGKKVAIIEKDALGGTCLNRGCIPSKMLIHSAELVDELNDFKKFNLHLNGKVEVDFAALTKRVNSSVSNTSKSIEKAYSKNENVTYFHGHARFVGNKVVEVNGEKMTADKIYIAVGTRPAIPNIEGLKGTPFMTSTEALKAQKQPKSMIVIGGGYIATELGYFYGALGTKVDFVVRSKFLSSVDDEVRKEFTNAFKEKFNCHLRYTTKKVSYDNGIFKVEIRCKDTKETKILQAESLFVATGIKPNSDDLGLENTEIKVSEKGYIEVDDYLQTSVEGVYALGDIIGRYFFRHSVNYEGEYLFNQHYLKEKKKKITYPKMPFAVFTNPQIAGVGETEEELINSGVQYFKGTNSYSSSAMGGDALQSEYGFCKLLFESKTRKLLAAHIIGKEASNMIHMLIAFINMGATLDDLLSTIYIHPALPEIVRNAARKAKLALSD